MSQVSGKQIQLATSNKSVLSIKKKFSSLASIKFKGFSYLISFSSLVDSRRVTLPLPAFPPPPSPPLTPRWTTRSTRRLWSAARWGWLTTAPPPGQTPAHLPTCPPANLPTCPLGLVKNPKTSIFFWDTLFFMYFQKLGGVPFLEFFDWRPPSFAKSGFKIPILQ